MVYAVYGLSLVLFGICFGIVTNLVIHNKGYKSNWFWWGFFFGIFALIVACTKPRNVDNNSYNSGEFQSTDGQESVLSGSSPYEDLRKLADLKAQGVITEEEFARLKAECMERI